jgi:hypothetical protein
MSFRCRLKFSAVAVSSALSIGPVPSRLVGVEVFFPDVGQPSAGSMGILRYTGEPSSVDRGPGATVPPSDHSQ